MVSPLIDVDEIILSDPALRIVDVRHQLGDPDWGRRQHRAGHIPGAVFLHLDQDLSGPPNGGRHPLPEWDQFRHTLGRAGIGDDDTVVVYDHGPGSIAARLWWMLDHLGHDRVHVLDGGWQAWVAGGMPISADATAPVPTSYTRQAQATAAVTMSDVANRSPETILVDARAPDRFSGRSEPIDAIAGHIPGAINLPHEANVTEAGRFVESDRLQERFGSLKGKDVVVYCGSGVTACHNILAMRLAGLESIALYPGSWSEWSSSGMPVATDE